MASIKIEIDGLSDEEARNLRAALERIKDLARKRHALQGQLNQTRELQGFVSQFVPPQERDARSRCD